MSKNKLILSVYSLFICLLIFQVFLSGRRATDGDQLADLNTVLDNIVLENERIRTRIYTYTSIENIEKYARNTNMVSATVRNLGSVSFASLFGQP
jgi:coenzyme F420-reducing hydrogenase delta subunit